MFYIPAGDISILPALGFSLILFSMLRLQKFEPVFKKAIYALYAAVPIGCVLLAMQIYTSLTASQPEWYGAIYTTVRLLCEICEIATMFFIYLGIRRIGEQTEIRTLEKQASRNMSVMFVYFFIEILFSILKSTVPQIFSGFEMVIVYPFIIGMIWRAMNVIMAGYCYMKIAQKTD